MTGRHLKQASRVNQPPQYERGEPRGFNLGAAATAQRQGAGAGFETAALEADTAT